MIAGDEEQLDKLLEVRAQAAIERIVVVDTRGIRQLSDPAGSYEELFASGGADAVEARAANPAEWREHVAAIRPEDVATVVFTPGTTGTPKGVLLSHANVTAASAAVVEAVDLQRSDEISSTLPLAEIAERSLCLLGAMGAGCTVSFGEGGGSLLNDLRDIQPTVFLGVPRLWEYFRTTVEAELRNAGRIKRTAVRRALSRRGRGLVSGARSWRGRSAASWGSDDCASRSSATAPLSQDLVDWWAPAGVRLRNAYDLAEASGLVTVMPADDVRAGSAGQVVSGVEVKVDAGGGEQGEVLVRGLDRVHRLPRR